MVSPPTMFFNKLYLNTTLKKSKSEERVYISHSQYNIRVVLLPYNEVLHTEYNKEKKWVDCIRWVAEQAAGLGLEPRLLGPEPSVLPLDDPAIPPPLLYNTIAPVCPQHKNRRLE